MFICQITGKVSKPGEKLNKITVETRERVYTQKQRDTENGEWVTVEIGRGWEIVKQLKLSDEGVNIWNSSTQLERVNILENLKSI